MTTDVRTTSRHVGAWPVLNQAERSALREVLVHGPLPRTEIARRLGLSRASLTRVTRTLIELDLVVEGGVEMRGRTGRPSELLMGRTDGFRMLGVKLTADVIYAVVTDLGARVVAAVEEPIGDRDFAAVVDQVAALHARLALEHAGIAALGVCLAGDLASDGAHEIVVTSAFLGWNDVDLVGELTARTGLPVAAENDVRALTAAEHWFGAGVGCDSFALLTVGTGLGFGLVVDGKVFTGHRGRAGRLDHLRIDASGPLCGHGHRGCAGVYLTSGSITESMRRTGLTYEDVVGLARAGDAAALQAFREAGWALGALIATVANAFDPEKIILTGDGLAVVELAGTAVRDAVAQLRDPVDAETPLDVQPFDFSEWARAGAVAALRLVLDR